ncbi:hypothetical protein PEC302107_16020 [Pectobacterium araliae]|nr:hypothetical protein PEC302107_16020 [Pectobacterium carotovorum subsp. carotovorum]
MGLFRFSSCLVDGLFRYFLYFLHGTGHSNLFAMLFNNWQFTDLRKSGLMQKRKGQFFIACFIYRGFMMSDYSCCRDSLSYFIESFWVINGVRYEYHQYTVSPRSGFITA